MRLWSLHPRNLDRAGLGAVWREGLQAQAVLVRLARGERCGYMHHPQLDRFKASGDPLGAIGAYLAAVCDEAERRGYRYDRAKIVRVADVRIPVTSGQLLFEADHLEAKVAARAPAELGRIDGSVHPLFIEVGGDIEVWERGVAA